jgi:hypothetical protein
MAVKKKSAPPPETSSIRWKPEDLELLKRLRQATGVRSVSELARLGLRALAKKEEIQ